MSYYPPSRRRPRITLNPVQRPPFQIPSAPPPKWEAKTVIPYVKTGMMIELSTIPLYLYAMYSIKPDEGALGTQARAAIRGVVEQEMLHLSLTGNLLCSLGDSMDLYDYKVVPRFPGHMLIQKIPLNLDRASKPNLECFLEIESPDTPRPPPNNSEPGLLPDGDDSDNEENNNNNNNDDGGNDIIPAYKSIGDFYEDLERGLQMLPDRDFKHGEDRQFSGLDFFDDQMVVINDKSSALKALTTIIEQGEGNVAVSESHYTVFVNLYLNPEGWQMHDVPMNPETKDYKGVTHNDYVYKLSVAFDAGYCYLLQTIQRVWKTGRKPKEIVLRLLLLRNIHAIMTNVVSPLAGIIVQQNIKNADAAPCFNYYPLDGNNEPLDPLDPTTLHKHLVKRVRDAADAAPSDQKKKLVQIADYIENKIPAE